MPNISPVDVSHLQALMLVTGISGAGKSKAVDAISDLGFFNIENLPIKLLRDFIEFSRSEAAHYTKIALIPDMSSDSAVTELLQTIDCLSPRRKVHIIFLDCANDTIIRRYSETRRPHPNFDPVKDKTLADAILRERSRLEQFKERANLVLDTTDLNIHDLKRALTAYTESIAVNTDHLLRLNFMSFGFKHGVPNDCDLLIDVRFLPNPYFIDTLRDLDGTHADVSAYVLQSEACMEFMHRYSELLTYLIPRYIHSGKAYLNIAIGCTGGKHRSVAIAEALKKQMQHPAYLVSATHRDKDG